MKIAIRLVIVLVVLVVVAGVALALLLPSIVASDAVREQVEAGARDALGRELSYEALDFRLLPPSAVVVAPRIAGAAEGDPAFLEAREVALRVALLPLLTATVLVDSLVVDGAVVRVKRTPEGLDLPGPASAPAEEGAPPPAPPSQPEGGGGSGVSLAVREVVVRDTRIVFDDHVVAPPVSWELRDVRVNLRGSSPGDPIDVDASLELASGGSVEAKGTATLAGELDLVLELDAVALGPAAPYLDGIDLAGGLSGTVTVKGPAADPARVTADLDLADARFQLDDIAFAGPLDLEAEIADAASNPNGTFEVDASQAELRYGGMFTKPPGTPARVSGRVVQDADGALGVDDLKLVIKNLDAQAQVRTSPSLRVDLETNTVELEGWDRIVPSLGAVPLTGGVRVEGITFTAPVDPGQKPRLTGRIRVEDLVVSPADLSPVTVRGDVEAKGTSVVADLVLLAAGQPIDLDASVREIFGSPRYEITVDAKDADADALASAYAGKPGVLFGPLDLSGTVNGVLDDRPPLRTLRGQLAFDIEDGKLVGASILEAVFAELGAISSAGNLALDAGRAFGGRDLQRFYGDDFESMRGELRISDAIANADDLAIVYRDYTVALQGPIDLESLGLDMKGRITIGPEIDAVIARNLQAGDSYQPRSRTLVLSGVKGTLDAPEVQIARNNATDFVTAYAEDVGRDRLRDLADDELGDGTGEAIEGGLDALRDILGR